MYRYACTALAAAFLLVGCASKPVAEVSKDQLTAMRKTHASMKVGQSQQEVLGAYKAGNKVKLGASMLDGAAIEEWKVEAFHDVDKGKDLFVAFLYFCNERFVDSSDTRIDFRNNPAVVTQWKQVTKH